MASRRLTPEEAAKRINVAAVEARAQAAEAALREANTARSELAESNLNLRDATQAAEADADRYKTALQDVQAYVVDQLNDWRQPEPYQRAIKAVLMRIAQHAEAVRARGDTDA